ncbi:matrix metalloproteinase-23 isoform X1 [Sorex araneus]|uniref:matrix metalloproteinase-23 isoform X1 n=1 Tax=Sorex araneus TaxID=42254 RepID=UPI0024334D07|nr:matrix metalloproteinase-23 isoform X1 [Sorex araneus]
MQRGASAPAATPGLPGRGGQRPAWLGALCLLPALLLLARLGLPATPSAVQEDVTSPSPTGVSGPPPPQAPRRRRYTLTPARLRWDRFNLTYRVLSFPRNLLSPSETRRGLAAAFRMWSEVSPFSFREVAPEQPSDLRIGFYPANHTDCLASALHHCFDGPTGELAHAFFPPHGGIHFDDSEYWILGPTRYSWKKGDGRLLPGAPPGWAPVGAPREGQAGRLGGGGPGSQTPGPARPRAPAGAELHSWGPSSHPYLLPERSQRSCAQGTPVLTRPAGVWLTDLVHVAAHEIGHALGLMHSLQGRALMHLNATLRGWKVLSQDELWGLHRLYGCLDRLSVCGSWARKGFCAARQRLMKRLCPSSCDFCYEFPFPTEAATPPPPRTKTRLVSEGRNMTFRCGQKILHKKGKVHWYKDQEPLEFSYPGYLALGEAHLSIIANAITEGTYTCVVRRQRRVLTTYSWRVRVRDS